MERSFITLEGMKIKTKTISKKELVTIWKTLTDRPFPKVKAFQLEDEDFDFVMRLRRCREDERRELAEWGRVLSVRSTDACVFSDGRSAGVESRDVDYVILVRENPYHSQLEILEHELSHIVRGDL